MYTIEPSSNMRLSVVSVPIHVFRARSWKCSDVSMMKHDDDERDKK